jgi:hypothetical protein
MPTARSEEDRMAKRIVAVAATQADNVGQDWNGKPILMATISKSLLLLATSMTMGLGVSARATGPYQPVCDIKQLEKLMGTVSISLGIDRVVSPTMSCLVSAWRDDKGGRTKFYVSNAFLSIMEANPRVFFSVMTREPKIFEEWLGDIENLSFTWSLDPPCGLETTRRHLILILQHSGVDAGKPTVFKNELIAKLSAIRCRQIN